MCGRLVQKWTILESQACCLMHNGEDHDVILYIPTFPRYQHLILYFTNTVQRWL